MSLSKKRAKVTFNQTDRQWVEIESVDEKIESLQNYVFKYLCESFGEKFDDENTLAVVMQTKPNEVDCLITSQLHRLHAQEEEAEEKQKTGEKRKTTADPGCERCHGELNEIFYRWLAQSTKVVKKKLKKVEAASADSITSTKMRKAESSKSKGKGKQRVIDDESKKSQENSNTKMSASTENEFECSICCEESVAMKESTKCMQGHQFCLSCARKLAETEIGLQRTKFECMHMEGCQSTFSEEEIRRFLKPETYRLWSQMRMVEEMRSACIPDLESCPFCFYAYVILPEDREKPFFCANVECGKWSCIECKKLLHEGKSCEESRMLNMNSAHKAEEKLAEALMRRCPKPNCNTVMIKDEGQRSCNKMSCIKCKTAMCYVCRKDITDQGYAHFDSNPLSDLQQSGNEKGDSPKKKCPLWDDTKERHKKDVRQARKEVGKLAPKITKAEKQDEKRRQANFEQRYGKNAPRIPGEWGFLAPNEDLNPFDPNFPVDGEFDEELFFEFARRPARRLGEAREEAENRRLQREAQLREVERQLAGNARRRDLENRDAVRIFDRERERHLPIIRNMDAIQLPPVRGNGVLQNEINVAERDLDELHRRRDLLVREVNDLVEMVGDYEDTIRYFRNQMNEILQDVNNIPNHAPAGRRNGLLASRVRAIHRQDGEPAFQGLQAPKGKTVHWKKDKQVAKPTIMFKKVNDEWKWVEETRNQSDNNKGEGSSKIEKTITVDRRDTSSYGELQAGSSHCAKLPKANKFIDLTLSDEDDDLYNMSERNGLETQPCMTQVLKDD